MLATWPERSDTVLWILAIALILLSVVGLVPSYTLGAVVHLLVGVAAILVFLRIFQRHHMLHVWHIFEPSLPEAQEAFEHIHRFMQLVEKDASGENASASTG